MRKFIALLLRMLAVIGILGIIASAGALDLEIIGIKQTVTQMAIFAVATFIFAGAAEILDGGEQK